MTKMAANWLKLIPNVWSKQLKNHALSGRTYLYSPYKGVPPSGARVQNPSDRLPTDCFSGDISFSLLQQLRRSQANVQFPNYCKPGHVSVMYLDVGQGWVKTNRISYNGAAMRNADVKFVTEQDGTGKILAKFNGVKLKCDGVFSMKRKTCTIPRALKPWSGTITVEIGRHPSTRFQMSGTPGTYEENIFSPFGSIFFSFWVRLGKYCQLLSDCLT